MSWRKGSQARSWQNSDQMFQVASLLPALELEISLEAAALIAPNSSWRCRWLEESQASGWLYGFQVLKVVKQFIVS